MKQIIVEWSDVKVNFLSIHFKQASHTGSLSEDNLIESPFSLYTQLDHRTSPLRQV